MLSCDFKKLAKINFESVEIHFKKDKISFTYSDLKKHLIDLERRAGIGSFIYHLQSTLTESDIINIKSILDKKTEKRNQINELRKFFNEKDILKSFRMPPSAILLDVCERLLNSPTPEFNKIKAVIKENVQSKILYFPTYRRIEEELQNLGIMEQINAHVNRHINYHPEYYLMSDDDEDEDEDINNNDNSLIQFGMDDVEKRIRNITGEISKSSVIGFSKLTGDMLIQLLRSYPDVHGIEKINIEDITIILNRVGDNLAKDEKDRVIELIKSNKIFETKNKQLIYFLQKLLDLYKSQALYDKAIKDFTTICNGYLNDKHYEYDESTVDLRIFRNDSTAKEEVSLSQLSSGEKQIVSLFSKIYLEPTDNFIVLFDEPELSLSIFWQKKLLPDILKSTRCDFLLAVTHSPFIFENDLVKHTIGLKEFFDK